jgi:hypothetical protein
MLPELKPWAMRELFVVPSIGSRDITCGERPDIGRFKHFLQLLNVVNDALNVHAFLSSGKRRAAVKRTRRGGPISFDSGKSTRMGHPAIDLLSSTAIVSVDSSSDARCNLTRCHIEISSKAAIFCRLFRADRLRNL